MGVLVTHQGLIKHTSEGVRVGHDFGCCCIFGLFLLGVPSALLLSQHRLNSYTALVDHFSAMVACLGIRQNMARIPCVLITLLGTETPKIKGESVHCSSWFAEVSIHSPWLQGGVSWKKDIAEEEEPKAAKQEAKKQAVSDDGSLLTVLYSLS